jgi:hypothetical protein
VAGRDLRALFASNDPRMDVDEAFTNRAAQWQLVSAALTEHLRRVTAPGFDVEDLEVPRDHITVFYGVGGIGKSTLSRRLEAALAGGEQRPAQWGEPPWAGARIVPVRIDLSRSAAMDFERVILTLRAALAGLGRPLPAFDLALRRYWEHHHPAEPLEEYLRRGGLAGRAARAMPGQLQSAAADVAQALLLPGTVGSAIGQVTGALVRALRERRQAVRALAGCARLADLLEAEPDLETLSFYPHLLAWELNELPEPVVPVVLLDGFEEISGDLERLLQRVVWLMPGAFFILTGRSRLRWAEPAMEGQLDWTGPSAWPGLAGHRQVLIGDFSPEDCEDYLARRLTRDGRPLISAALRRTIAERSHGLPLYLDLSVMRFLEIRRTSREPEPADFAAEIPALVERTLQDLSPGERHAARAAALLDAFDADLLTRTAGLTRQAPALQLIERPLVREDPWGVWPYHLHALIRSTIRTVQDTTEDRWSPADWRHAAERALAALGEQWRAAPAPSRRHLIACLRQGLALAGEYALELGWLADAAWAYVDDSVWEPLAPPAPQAGPPTIPAPVATPAQALIELLRTLARRQREHREHTVTRLAALRDTGLLPPELQEMALYYLAKAQRDIGRTEASRQSMQRVADAGGHRAAAAQRGLAHLARLSGDFPTALAVSRTLGWAGRGHRVEGDVWWPQGDMDRAAAAYAAARGEAEQHGVAGERATSQAQRAWALAFTDPEVADDEIALAEQLLTGLDLRATRLTVRMAGLVRDAGTDPADGIEDRAWQLRTEITNAGLAATQSPTLELALAFHHAVRDDQEQVAAVISRLRQLTTGGDYTYYADLAHFMADLPLDTPSTAQWIDGPQTTRQRWRSLVTTRRRHLGDQR